MMKKIIGLFILVIVFLSVVCSAQDSSTSKERFRLDYKISVYDPLNRSTDENVYCVNTTLYLNITNRNTHKGLNNVEVTAYVNGTQAVEDRYSDYNGIALVPIRFPGLYKLRILKTGYMPEISDKSYNFTVCTSTTTTITSTTTTSTEETTTSTIAVSTTTTVQAATTSSTLITIAESCTDGLLNQDETAVDCGGPCSPCAQIDFSWILFAVFIIGVFAIIVYFAVKGSEKNKEKPKQHKHEGHNHEHQGNYGNHKEEKQ